MSWRNFDSWPVSLEAAGRDRARCGACLLGGLVGPRIFCLLLGGLSCVAALCYSPRAWSGEEIVGITRAKVREDDPSAKWLWVSAGLGIFGYNTYMVGGWGGDLTYLSPYFFSFSAMGFATVRASSDATDRKVRPFYDGTLRLHLYDTVGPEYAKIRLSGFLGSGKFVASPVHSRETVSLRGGAFSWGKVLPTAFAGIAYSESMHTSAYIPSYDLERTLSSNYEIYLDAIFPTGDNLPGDPNDRIGGRLGFPAEDIPYGIVAALVSVSVGAGFGYGVGSVIRRRGEEPRHPASEPLVLIILGLTVLLVALFVLLALIDAVFFG